MMFDTWAARIATATDEAARRALLAELAAWRVRHLSDVAMARDGTWAIAMVLEALGETGKARSEAEQLMSLCQQPPLAPKEAVYEAKALVSRLGGHVVTPRPVREPREPRPERAPRPERSREPRETVRAKDADPLAEARAAAALGHSRKVRRLLADRRGVAAASLRAWSLLFDGLQGDEASLRAAADQAMGELLGHTKAEAAPVASDALDALLGAPLPTKRRAAISALEAFAASHPAQVDALVEAALRRFAGQEATWLAGLVASAWVAGGERTRASLTALRRDGSALGRAFDAWPFHRALRLAAAAVGAGWSLDGLREGVLSREEPAGRRVWTLRLTDGSGQRMVAIAPHATDAWPDGVADALAARIAGLAPGGLLLASGGGNEALRHAAAAAGLVVVDEDEDDASLLGRLAACPPIARAAHAEAAPVAAAGEAPPGALAALLTAEEAPSDEALAEVVAGFRRASAALRVAERALDPAEGARWERVAPLLRAVHAATEPEVRLPGGTTLALRAAAAGDAAAREVLLKGDTAGRYGGAGTAEAIDVAATLVSAGWDVYRVLRGVTRRESDAHPVLGTFADELGDVWRLLVRRGEVQGEVWFVAAVGPEGRAALPHLLAEPHPRAVVLPIDPDLLGWFGSLGVSDAIGWTGDDTAPLLAAVDAWSAA